MSDIKKCFISRWKDKGYIVEADYSQLEVIGLAYLTQDKQLYKDIIDGVDMHAVNAEKLFGKSFTPLQRKIAKSFSFQLQYGAGAASMAKSNNVDVKLAKRFIENYYSRYPQVKIWQDSVAEEVRESRKPTGEHTSRGFPKGKGVFRSITGREYVFYEFDNDHYNPHNPNSKEVNFSPTQMKNYPVQGFATGDIVPLVIGRLNRILKNNSELSEKCLLTNTVHDSIILDVHEDIFEEAVNTVVSVMESAPEFIEETWGFKFDLPLPVGISYGRNWYDQKEIK